MSFERVLLAVCLILLSLVTSTELEFNEEVKIEEVPEEIPEPGHKCLRCTNTTELMCYNNQTCPKGKKYCYFQMWQPLNANKTKWDPDYYTNWREWGCTESNQTCYSECKERDCVLSKIACCNADMRQLEGNWSMQHAEEYRKCYYGGSAPSGALVNVQLLLSGLVMLDRYLGAG